MTLLGWVGDSIQVGWGKACSAHIHRGCCMNGRPATFAIRAVFVVLEGVQLCWLRSRQLRVREIGQHMCVWR